VEGNVDDISMMKYGFVNTVACMGTALTQFHAKIFRRFGSVVFLCFDGDSAGKKAAVRSVKILTDEGLEVRVIQIPDNLDPDDYLKRNGADAMRELIKKSVGVMDFRLDCLAAENDTADNIGKTKYIKGAIEILKECETLAERELYLPKVAAASGIPAASIRVSFNRDEIANNSHFGDIKNTRYSSARLKSKAQAQLFVIASILHKRSYAKPDEVPEFDSALYERIRKTDMSSLCDELTEDELQNIQNVIEYKFIGSDKEQEQEWKDDVAYLHKAETDKKIAELKENKEMSPVEIAKEIQKLKESRNG
jgi:DNA primase